VIKKEKKKTSLILLVEFYLDFQYHSKKIFK
jgi:hypothetical protein